MVRLWIKVLRDNKIVKQTTVDRDEKFTYANFADYISEGCYRLDEHHIMNFAKFRRVVFLPSDFVEKVDFDKLVVENLEE